MLTLSGDTVVLETRVDAGMPVENKRLDVAKVQIETDITVEIAVVTIARIALVAAPDLPR